jgi:hypothetical protein
MDVLRHNYVPTDEPILGPVPGIAQCILRMGIREYRFSAFRAHRQEHNNWRVKPLVNRLVNRMFTSDGVL